MSRGLLALGPYRPAHPSLFTPWEASFSPCAEKLSQSLELEVMRPVQVAWYGVFQEYRSQAEKASLAPS